MTQTTPRTFSHIGLSVPDLDRAVEFYRDVMGFYVIMEPTEIAQDDSDIGVMCDDVFGPGWGRFRIAHLATADRIGFELFEFPEAYKPENNLPYRQTGLFHFAIQDPDLEGLLARIVAICDSFDAMSSSRTYRAAMPREEVLAEIRTCAGRLYDPRIVPVFLGMDLTEYDRLLRRDAAGARGDQDEERPDRKAA